MCVRLLVLFVRSSESERRHDRMVKVMGMMKVKVMGMMKVKVMGMVKVMVCCITIL